MTHRHTACIAEVEKNVILPKFPKESRSRRPDHKRGDHQKHAAKEQERARSDVGKPFLLQQQHEDDRNIAGPNRDHVRPQQKHRRKSRSKKQNVPCSI